jgi:hypothetical protein
VNMKQIRRDVTIHTETFPVPRGYVYGCVTIMPRHPRWCFNSIFDSFDHSGCGFGVDFPCEAPTDLPF